MFWHKKIIVFCTEGIVLLKQWSLMCCQHSPIMNSLLKRQKIFWFHRLLLSTHTAQVAESRNQVVLLIEILWLMAWVLASMITLSRGSFEFHSIVWYGSTTRD